MPRQARPCKSKKKNGEPCSNYAMNGATVCHSHGGRAPQVKAAARRRLEREAATKAMTTYGLPREIAPDIALLEEVHRTAGHVAWLYEIVKGIEQDDLVWGKVEEVDKGAGEFTGTDTTYRAQANIWLDLYQRERKHLTDVCKAALTAGIAERQVKLAEQQGTLIAQVITRILDDLSLSADQRALVSTVVPRHLMAVAEAA